MGDVNKTYIIAEAGVNHNGSLALAKELVSAASEAGADAVKFQMFKTSSLVTADAKKVAYQARETGGGEGQREMLLRLELSEEQHEELFRFASGKKIDIFTTA